MRRKSSLLAAAFAASLLLFSYADSHDIMLLADRFLVPVGDTLVVRQLVAVDSTDLSVLQVDEEVPLARVITTKYTLFTPDRSIDLLGELPDFKTQPEVKPVLRRALDFEGLALVTMDHAFIYTAFSDREFDAYLEHEDVNVEAISDHLVHKHIQTERYARTLKSLVQVGESAAGDLHKKVVGQRLEILLLQNPYALDPGDDMDVQILFDGKPLESAAVTAYTGSHSKLESTRTARTNKDGVVRFELDKSGLWLVRLVHLYPCSKPDVDWESYWASYAFELN